LKRCVWLAARKAGENTERIEDLGLMNGALLQLAFDSVYKSECHIVKFIYDKFYSSNASFYRTTLC